MSTRVLYVMGTSGGSGRYRCHHRVEQLASVSFAVDVIPFGECDLTRVVHEYHAFVLHRVKYSPRVARFLVAARRRRAPVLYDTDDLVFEPDLVEQLQLPEGMTYERRREKLERQRRTLQLCDAVTVSTEPLAERARRWNARVAVAPNVVTEEMVELGRVADGSARRRDDVVTLGYFSGSATHDRDFATIADPLLRVLSRRPEARLRVVGPLALDPRFDLFGDRVDRAPLVPWRELPSLLASVDVSLAPLEQNAFAEGKSCVKFLEAALVEVPTVASATPDFVRVIAHGKNGLVASTDREWEVAVEQLVTDPSFRARLGAAAAAHVRSRETATARAGELAVTLGRLFDEGRPGRARAVGAAIELTRGTLMRRVRKLS